jgi:hypothetical protein
MLGLRDPKLQLNRKENSVIRNIPQYDHNCSSIDFHLFHVMDSTSGSKKDVNDTLSALGHLKVSAGTTQNPIRTLFKLMAALPQQSVERCKPN